MDGQEGSPVLVRCRAVQGYAYRDHSAEDGLGLKRATGVAEPLGALGGEKEGYDGEGGRHGARKAEDPPCRGVT